MHMQMYRQAAHMGKPGGMNPPGSQGGAPDHSFNPAAGPPGGVTQAGGPQFSATPLTRLGQTKPNLVGMLPPQSPAMKEGIPGGGPGGKDNKPGMPNGQPPPQQGQQQGMSGQPTHNPDGSPRNLPPGGNGTAPQTPVPNNQTAPGQPQQSQPGGPPPPPQQQQQQQPQQQQNPPLGGNMMTSMLGMPMNMSSGMNVDLGMFDQSFNLDDFDAFKPDGDINFERDFGQWFSPEETSGLDLK